MSADIKTWQERMPKPRAAFQCDMNCSGVGMCAVRYESCGDCMPITISGDPLKARDEEIADLRAERAIRPAVVSEGQAVAPDAGILAAVNFIEKRAADYIQENASTENDTGAVVFHFGDAGRDYHSTLIELADDLRALQTSGRPTAPAPEAPTEPMPPNWPAYGIIDPDYARYYSIIRATAWQYGYAIGMHGSFTRDLDLIAVPWADNAREPDLLVKVIVSRTDLTEQHSNPGIKPHGRRTWTLLLPGFGDPRWVDLSILPLATPSTEQAPTKDSEQKGGA